MPVYDATVAARCKAHGLPAARQDEHRRVRDGLVDRELRLRPDAQPVGPDPRAGRLGRRLGRGGRGRARAVGARLRHRRLDQAAGGALRQRRPAPDLRHRLALRRRRVRVVARPGRARSRKNVRDCALLYSIISGRDENDSTTVDVPAGRAADRRGPEGRAHRRAAGAERRRGDRAGRARRPSRRRSRWPSRSAPRSRSARCRCSVDYGLRLLLPGRAGRGVVEPRALRRRPLRAARRTAPTSARW